MLLCCYSRGTGVLPAKGGLIWCAAGQGGAVCAHVWLKHSISGLVTTCGHTAACKGATPLYTLPYWPTLYTLCPTPRPQTLPPTLYTTPIPPTLRSKPILTTPHPNPISYTLRSDPKPYTLSP